ncbi:ATP-binding protein [Nocardia thailandica]|uniref:ATP-binding protein n=1 Tax=Nocardia thailandica TaxID=257275 RepID=UPI00031BD9A8|nr:LuxR C-terminal-related transcriptional regulator [Nocardia thailandica]
MVHSDLDPVATSYLGREADIDAVARLVGGHRLVSITGTGGLGKTRLARKVAVRLAGRGEVLFVELAGLRHDREVAPAVAAALGLRIGPAETAEGRVLDHLSRRALLLVLDNCEHLTAGGAEFAARVLDRCGDVRVLATSRQSLRVAGERVYRVPPLAAPDPGVDEPAAVAAHPAAALLIDRGRAVRADFRITAGNAAEIAELCRLLDGVPLAIELAAARLRALTPRQILDRWRGSLGLPGAWSHGVPDRHRTVRATVEWSYRLCTEDERRAWARLSIFQDWFELEAAEHLCADAGLGAATDVVMDALVDKSILERRGQDIAQFRLPSSLRELGREELDAHALTEAVARRHRDWFRRLVLDADRDFAGPRQDELVGRLRTALPDLRRALEWSLGTGEPGVAVEMVTRVDEFWTMTAANHEARAWLRRGLAAAPPGPRTALGHAIAALHSLWLTDRAGAERDLAAAEAADPGGDRVVAARIGAVRAMAAKIDLDNRRAAHLAESAIAVLLEHGHEREVLAAWNTWALATAADDPVRRLAELRAAVAHCAARGEIYHRSTLLFSITLIETMRGEPAAGAVTAREALGFTRRWDSRFGDAYHVESLAWVAAAQRRFHRAATLFGIAAAAWETLGADPAVVLVRPHSLYREATVAALGADAFDRAHRAGRALPQAEAVAFALAGESPTAPVGHAPLTGREFEVATLVADGRTNREIAAELVIATRTADTHVRNILTKLDLANRTQLAAWVLARSAAHAANT